MVDGSDQVSQDDNVLTFVYESDKSKRHGRDDARAGEQYGEGRQRRLGEEVGA